MFLYIYVLICNNVLYDELNKMHQFYVQCHQVVTYLLFLIDNILKVVSICNSLKMMHTIPQNSCNSSWFMATISW
jgi:hypothetical protein